MNLQSTLIAIAAISVSAPAAAAEDVDIVARVRLHAGSETVAAAYLAPGKTQRVNIDSVYAIDLTHRRGEEGQVVYEYRLLQRDGDAFSILHTATRRLPAPSSEPIGYSICGESVTFISHPEESLPACSDPA